MTIESVNQPQKIVWRTDLYTATSLLKTSKTNCLFKPWTRHIEMKMKGHVFNIQSAPQNYQIQASYISSDWKRICKKLWKVCILCYFQQLLDFQWLFNVRVCCYYEIKNFRMLLIRSSIVWKLRWSYIYLPYFTTPISTA